MSAWQETDEQSILIIGPSAAPVTVHVEQWLFHDEWWAVSVYVGKDSQATPIFGSGRRAPGHPSREAAKAAGLEALSAWLRTVAEQASAAMAVP